MVTFNPELHPRDSHGRFRMTAGEAKDFIDGHYGKWRGALTPAQEKGMRFYQSPGFVLMNGQLRGLEFKDLRLAARASEADMARAKVASKNLASAIKTAPPLEHAITVSRAFSADQFGKLKVGQTITDKAFVSVSLTDNTDAVSKVGKTVSAEIELPPGTKAAAGTARELVLPPGATFYVKSVVNKGGSQHVIMDYVLPGKKG